MSLDLENIKKQATIAHEISRVREVIRNLSKHPSDKGAVQLLQVTGWDSIGGKNYTKVVMERTGPFHKLQEDILYKHARAALEEYDATLMSQLVDLKKELDRKEEQDRLLDEMMMPDDQV